MPRARTLTFVLALALPGLGCDRESRSTAASAASVQPCECVCAQADSSGAAVDPYAVAELVATANRNMMHGDGAGCLAALDQAQTLAPKLAGSLIPTRAQCDMLVGRCQEGKQLIVDHYRRELAMSREQADNMAESLAAMRCRGGDSTERDKLLAALMNLQNAAFVSRESTGYCEENLATVRRLLPRVKPKSEDDSRVINAEASLFSMVPLCFQRAGNCKRSREVMDEVLPPRTREAYAKFTPKQRELAIQTNWESIVPKCKGKI